MTTSFAIAAAAGSLRSTVRADASLPHRWTDEGVAVQTEFTGAHLLHMAVAACVLNDLYRESAGLGVRLEGVRVEADGSFDTGDWRSTGISYRVRLDHRESNEHVVEELLRVVDQVAEIPRALRAGIDVVRVVDGG